MKQSLYIQVGRVIGYILVYLSLVIAVSSCKSTKRVPEGEYLLNSVSIVGDIDPKLKSDLKNQILQKPNERILGVRYPLWRYNLRKPIKAEEKLNSKKSYEAPVIWDTLKNVASLSQMQSLLMSKGYFHPIISDTVLYSKKKVNVEYRVETGIPYRIRNIIYDIRDKNLSNLILKDSDNALIKTGDLLDQQILTDERSRIETFLREDGYFAFLEDYIHYKVDTFYFDRVADLYIVVENRTNIDSSGTPAESPHSKYMLKDVSVTLQPSSTIENFGNYAILDTINKEIYFRRPSKTLVKPSVVSKYISLKPGEYYSVSKEQNTYQNLMKLQNFKLVNIDYKEGDISSDSTSNYSVRELLAEISLSPFKKHQISTDFQATYAEGDPGGLVVMSYNNLSLFGGAEIFDVKARFAMESLKARQQGMYPNTKEYGLELSINLPKPLLFSRNRANNHGRTLPRTVVSAGYNYLQRPEYRRTISSASIGYTWGKNNIQHTLKPLEFYYVNSDMSDDYRELIKGMFIESSYLPHTVLGASYGITFTNQNRTNSSWYYWGKMNMESAGGLLSGLSSMIDFPKDENGYETLFHRPYSQYLRGDIDFRIYQNLNPTGNNQLVYRTYIGIGHPYDNSTVMPFEKRFYAGGAYGIRGWRIYSLGPGSFKDKDNYFSSTGDIRLEFNLESRFKLFWVINGALFVDAGNIWDAKSDPMRMGANFKWNRFAKEIAVSAGFGLRFDFSFFVGRFDVGFQMRDPAEGYLWNNKFDNDMVTLNFGIGYPF